MGFWGQPPKDAAQASGVNGGTATAFNKPQRGQRELQLPEQTTEGSEGTESGNCLEQTTEENEHTENCNSKNKK